MTDRERLQVVAQVEYALAVHCVQAHQSPTALGLSCPTCQALVSTRAGYDKPAPAPQAPAWQGTGGRRR